MNQINKIINEILEQAREVANKIEDPEKLSKILKRIVSANLYIKKF